MRRFGIIGDPIAGSLSPALFHAAYGGRYPYDLIGGSDFTASWERFRTGYDGINITAPFKQDAYAEADLLSPEAAVIRAVNLAVKTPQGIQAYNTDYMGVKMALAEALAARAGRPASALVIGCGGAGRAAAVAASDLGCRVTLLNRTHEKAEALAAEFADRGFDIAPAQALREACRARDILIYTASGPLDALRTLRPSDLVGRIVLEAGYKAPLLDRFPGTDYRSGRRWLLYQAIAGYRLFTGEDPDRAAMAGVLQ